MLHFRVYFFDIEKYLRFYIVIYEKERHKHSFGIYKSVFVFQYSNFMVHIKTE